MWFVSFVLIISPIQLHMSRLLVKTIIIGWMPDSVVLYFSFFKYTDQSNMVTLAWPLVWVWGGTICFFRPMAGALSVQETCLNMVLMTSPLFIFVYFEKGIHLLCLQNFFFALLYFAKSGSFPEVCHCQQYGGNSLWGHDGNITSPSQVLEWLLLEKKQLLFVCFCHWIPSPPELQFSSDVICVSKYKRVSIQKDMMFGL